jgi:hypothetical protein
MSNDVQAAAERLRNADASGINYDDIYGRGEELDWLTLARAYLALHDPTPLDEAWQRCAVDTQLPADVLCGKCQARSTSYMESVATTNRGIRCTAFGAG